LLDIRAAAANTGLSVRHLRDLTYSRRVPHVGLTAGSCSARRPRRLDRRARRRDVVVSRRTPPRARGGVGIEQVGTIGTESTRMVSRPATFLTAVLVCEVAA
jgi:hypothetical protein